MKEKDIIEQQIIMAIKTVVDPEIPVDVYELGLIYDIDIKTNKDVEITMTLTSPNCPVAESLPEEVRTKVEYLQSVNKCKVNIVFEPTWNASYMSDEAKLELGML
jgi:FeS assembly SUF system protein